MTSMTRFIVTRCILEEITWSQTERKDAFCLTEQLNRQVAIFQGSLLQPMNQAQWVHGPSRIQSIRQWRPKVPISNWAHVKALVEYQVIHLFPSFNFLCFLFYFIFMFLMLASVSFFFFLIPVFNIIRWRARIDLQNRVFVLNIIYRICIGWSKL